ncbi:MAG: imidazole glycerol phosphate synthase subunit HisH [Spirochaetales bacterium]|nr:imidazole glycerol phosphate synthase subunit HisH [Spirochaetales bacterium]
MIAVIDYDSGNLTSVSSALKFLKADFFVTKKPEDLSRADKVIFPGVGEAVQAMGNLNKSGMGEALKAYAAGGKPFLGICMGSQILFDHSEERDADCLGILPGKVLRFPSDMGMKIPQIGWNTVDFKDDPLTKGLSEEDSFYFVHSYYISPATDDLVLGKSEYGIPFTAAVRKDNVWATQFHPEKSGKPGLKILDNFINL